MERAESERKSGEKFIIFIIENIFFLFLWFPFIFDQFEVAKERVCEWGRETKKEMDACICLNEEWRGRRLCVR